LKIITFFFLTICLNTYGQKQGNIWYFDDSCGLDFSSGYPVVLTDGNIYTSHGTEGTAVICDSYGNLLFYASAETVWNKNHQVMPHGGDLLGGASSTQGAFIIPRPGSDNLFYLFTTDEFQNDLVKGLRYSMINMCLDGGLGDVDTTEKNILLLDTVAEKMAGTNHSNGTDIWLVTHKFYSDAFHALRISSSGIIDSVISHVGSYEPITPTVAAAIGQMKISPDGSKLALVCSNTAPSVVELYDFDNSSGIVSNAISLPPDGGEYGVAFSADNSKLYISTSGSLKIFQYDVMAGSTSAIIDSKTLIFDNSSWPLTGMQLGPDGKIYIAGNYDHLDVINNPNAAGLACNYSHNSIYLGHVAWYGITNFIDSYIYNNGKPFCNTSFTDTITVNNNVSVYPNPFDNQLTIEFSSSNHPLASFELYNEIGQLIFDVQEISEQKLVISEISFATGMYLYKIYQGKSIITIGKLVLQR